MNRIGVFICHCGFNIARSVDVKKVALECAKIDGVVFATHYVFLCSQPGQKIVEDAVKDHKLNGIIVANCSPTLHERTFLAQRYLDSKICCCNKKCHVLMDSETILEYAS